MQSNKTTIGISLREVLLVRLRAYSALVKVRLATLVVFSAIFGYMMAPTVAGFDVTTLLFLALGGFLVTGASNALNQIFEADYDRLMTRTQNRPMVQGTISTTEAVIFALVCAVGGILILGYMFEGLVPALLGIIALLSYAFVYTPMKRMTSLGVLVGAFPGAMPPLIGWAAATGTLGWEAWMLFLIQFLWQFPHFWAIGWVLEDDYKKAGFKMLPGNPGRSTYTASLVLIYTVLQVPAISLAFMADMIAPVAFAVMIVAALGFSWQALTLLRQQNVKSASRLMFGSFLYLPVVQIAMLIDKF